MAKRKDGYYVVTKVIQGARKYFYGKTKREAEAQRDEYMEAMSQCRALDPYIALAEWATHWLSIKKQKSPSPHFS